MRYRVVIAFKNLIPLFAERPSHSSAPLVDRTAGARSAGQGRPLAGARALPLAAASTLAGWRRSGNGALYRYAVLLIAGALCVCAAPDSAVAQTASAGRPAAASPYATHIAEAAQRFGIPEDWVRAVLSAESDSDPHAVSSAGARGLMQVMPATWEELRVRYRLGHDPWQPRDNILAGTAYLREMWNRYGNVGAMLAAYNAGPGRYDEYLATGRPLPAKTRAYVAALAPLLGGKPLPEAVASPSAAPTDWRDAPLFVVRAHDGGTSTEPEADPQTGDLFVSISTRTRP